MELSSLLFAGCLFFAWAVYLWETYLSWRQYLVYRNNKTRPPEAEDVINAESFSKSRSYKLDKKLFGFVTDLWGHLESNVVLLFGFIPLFWRIAGSLLASWGIHDSEIAQSVVFLFLTFIVSTIIDMPFTVYDTFVIEQKHGFNQQTVGFFVKDQLKKIALMLAIQLPVAAALIWIIKSGGDYFFVYVWLFLLVLTLFLMTIYPEFIAPLFDKYTPLPDGELKEKIEALAHKLSFPLKKLYVVEGSKRSAHSNAYMYGFWKNKRIVLYDTLLENYNPVNQDTGSVTPNSPDHNDEATNNEDVSPPLPPKTESEKKKKKGCTNDEVVAVLAHELGHWALNHVFYSIIISEVNLFLSFWLFGMLYRAPILYEAFGFYDSQPTLIGILVIFQFLFAPYNEVLSFVMTWLSRRNEFAADRFAGNLKYSDLLCSALTKLGADNLTFPVDDWLYSTWHYSHPPLLERLKALKTQKAKSQ